VKPPRPSSISPSASTTPAPTANKNDTLRDRSNTPQSHDQVTTTTSIVEISVQLPSSEAGGAGLGAVVEDREQREGSERFTDEDEEPTPQVEQSKGKEAEPQPVKPNSVSSPFLACTPNPRCPHSIASPCFV
jgi:hypothetical protein